MAMAMAMATSILSHSLPLKPTLIYNPRRVSSSLIQPNFFSPFPSPLSLSIKKVSNKIPINTFAYVTGPASDPVVNETDRKVDDGSDSDSQVQLVGVLNWGLFWNLLKNHKLRLFVSLFTLIGCTTCTLSMPLFSGRFFEVLIGAKPGPLWRLLSTVGVLYALEPIFTVMFVINMNTIWEKVMSRLRAQIFGRLQCC